MTLKQNRMKLIAGAAAGCLVFLLSAFLVRGDGEFTLVQALVLGVIEGITEYLPVSSTGHLLAAQNLMGLTRTEASKSAADAYAIIIQIGAILAVTGLYRNRVRQMVLGLLGRDRSGLDLVFRLVTAFVPAAVTGLLFSSLIKQYLFGMLPVTVGWLAGGIVILLFAGSPPPEHPDGRAGIDDMRLRQALVIGLFQIAAL